MYYLNETKSRAPHSVLMYKAVAQTQSYREHVLEQLELQQNIPFTYSAPAK